MKASANIIKLGLYGTPGAGKSTTSQIISDYCDRNRIPMARIKLADPLYEAQAAIYQVAGRKLNDFYEQDGELLNFLGSYLRKINPNVLLDRFSERLLEEIVKLTSFNTYGLIVCDDLRRLDADFLKKKDFIFVRIVADRQLCEQRRVQRGDRSLGSASHSTEQGLDEILPQYVIENNATVQDLQTRVVSFMEELQNDSNRNTNPS